MTNLLLLWAITLNTQERNVQLGNMEYYQGDSSERVSIGPISAPTGGSSWRADLHSGRVTVVSNVDGGK